MAYQWTADRIAALTLSDVKALAENARAAGSNDLLRMCEEELTARKPKPTSKNKLPEGFVRTTRTTQANALERDASEQLVHFANGLLTKFDLSKERARALSVGVKGFVPHELLDAKGNAKVGGAQRLGLVAFDRYISYRVGENRIALNTILGGGDDPSKIQYQVIGSQALLVNSRPLAEIRPYIPEGISVGASNEFGEDFDSFESASNRFLTLMDQVAPKK